MDKPEKAPVDKEEKVFRSQTYRLYPTSAQEAELNRWLIWFNVIWNRLVGLREENQKEVIKLPKAERKGKYIGLKQLSKHITSARHLVPEINTTCSYCGFSIARRFVRCISSYLSLYKRWVKEGCNPKRKPEAPGYKRLDEYTVIDNEQTSSLRLRSGKKFGRFDCGKMKDLKVRLHRPLPGELRSASIMKCPDGWYVKMSYIPKDPLVVKPTTKTVGVNLGVRNIIARTDGEKVPIPQERWQRIAERIARLDKIASRRQKGSNRYKKIMALRRKAYCHWVKSRDHFLQKWSFRMARDFSEIALEKMDLAKMIEESGGTKCRKTGVKAKTIANAAVGKFVTYLKRKMEERSHVLWENNPADTTRTCSKCGFVNAKIPLHIRVFKCVQCGHAEDREFNAAKNNEDKANL
jgi:transposase